MKNNISSKCTNYIYFTINSALLSLITIIVNYMYFTKNKLVEDLFSKERIGLLIGLFIIYYLIFYIISTGKRLTKFRNYFIGVVTNPLTTVLLSIIVFRYWYFDHFSNYVLYYDSKTYTSYPYNLFMGETDIFRTPGYPYFLKLIAFVSRTEVGGNSFYNAVALTQNVLSIISVVILYFALKKFFKNKYINLLTCLVFGCAPAVISWNLCLLTESLSIFITVLLIYLVFSYLHNPSKTWAICLGLYTFVLVMVRPAFVYMYAILGVFFLARFLFCKADRKRCIAGLLALVVAGGMLVGYCKLNDENYNYFCVSSVSTTVNNLYIVMTQGMWNNPDYPELSKYLDEQMMDMNNTNWITDIIELLPATYAYSEIDGYVNSCIKKNFNTYIKYTVEKIKLLKHEKIGVQYTGYYDKYQSFKETDLELLFYTFPFSYMGSMIIVGLGIVWTLLFMIIKKRITWQIIGLSAIVFTHIFVSVIGSMAEFSRLSIMVAPALLIMSFYIIDYVISAIKSHKVFNVDDMDSTAIKIK